MNKVLVVIIACLCVVGCKHDIKINKKTTKIMDQTVNRMIEFRAEIDDIKTAIGYDSNNYAFFGTPYKPHSHLMYQMNKKIDLLIEYLELEYVEANSRPEQGIIQKRSKNE